MTEAPKPLPQPDSAEDRAALRKPKPLADKHGIPNGDDKRA